MQFEDTVNSHDDTNWVFKLSLCAEGIDTTVYLVMIHIVLMQVLGPFNWLCRPRYVLGPSSDKTIALLQCDQVCCQIEKGSKFLYQLFSSLLFVSALFRLCGLAALLYCLSCKSS